MGRDSRSARTEQALNEARATVGAWALRVAAANKRMTELECELAAAREEVSRQQNQVHSLERSLDLSAGENADLAKRLSKSARAADGRSFQLDQMKAVLKEAEAERERQEERHSQQLAALNAELEAMALRAAKAEQLFANAQQTLLADSFENSAAKRQIAGLEASVQEKERQLAALNVAQSELIVRIESRDVALVRAEERIRSLADLFLQLEKKGQLAGANGSGNNGTSASTEQRTPAAVNAVAMAVRSSCAILRRDLENDAWLFGSRDTLRVA